MEKSYEFNTSQLSKQEVFNGYLNSYTPSIKHPDDLFKSWKERFHDIRRLQRWKNLGYIDVTPRHQRHNKKKKKRRRKKDTRRVTVRD